MALVMLPCDLPWWPTIVRHLMQTAKAKTTDEMVESMLRIHNMCNVGLDPDDLDSPPDLEVFDGLSRFLNEEFTVEERTHFFDFTLPSMAQRALDLKKLRPPNGLHFSLQQQVDKFEFSRDFIASLLANCFFSTFPKRTIKTHPTLQDCNFTNFFKHLNKKHQKCKLLSIFHYFDYIESNLVEEEIALSRQVMSGAHWLTIEDWLSCTLPLCPLLIKRKGDIHTIGSDHIIVCSSSNRIGGGVLNDGNSMECIQLTTSPELLVILLCVEALEDNEVLIAEGVLQVARILEPKGNASLETLSSPKLRTICCMDAEDYSDLPQLQHQQDSVLRELNKALLGFRQKAPISGILPRRLSPIGESFSSTPEKDTSIKKAEPIAHHSTSSSVDRMQTSRRFIVLGSSGECLPVTRHPSRYSSCHSTASPEFLSARTSFTDEDFDEVSSKNPFGQDERKSSFADRLKEALDRAEVASTESDESELRFRRDGSCGFVLDGESQRSENFRREFKRSASSKYSFTTDYSSDLELVYEQLGRWLDEDGVIPPEVDMKAVREKAVIQFAGNLLKRTLSESFVGISVTEGLHEEIPSKSVKIAARSLSLELARHKNKLAAQLVSVVLNRNADLMPIATCNWGCSSKKGEPQLKLLIQWLAASVALLPHILYFTAENTELNKLDTVCRVLLDRQWSVGELVSSLLQHSETKLLKPELESSFFEHIIKTDERPSYGHRSKISST